MTTITTILALPPDLVERDRVRRQAQRAGSVTHPGLAPLREVAFAGEGLAVTWEIPAGDPLDPGSAGQALTILAPVAAGLAALHDAGMAHGGVSASSIYVGADGGVLAGWRPGGTAEGDVTDLVSVLQSWLPAESVGADVVQILIAGVDPDPQARPSMARIAAVLDMAARSERGRVTGLPSSPPAQRRARLVERPAESTVPMTRDIADQSPPPQPARQERLGRPAGPGRTGRGRHAAQHGSAVSLPAVASAIRIPWRWGLALAGAAAVAFLGLSSVTSAGSAEVICPAPLSSPVAAPAG